MYVCPSIFFDRVFHTHEDVIAAFDTYRGEKDTTTAVIYKEISHG